MTEYLCLLDDLQIPLLELFVTVRAQHNQV
jgi:hypothetical protein